ncbi:MAG: DUF370 domain-containing protein [Clostridia bacterium]|nr:DUF370 domain-containing protein [Clostridia bacterium]
MYIQLGNEKAIAIQDIIAITDLENTVNSAVSMEYFRRLEKEKKIVDVAKDLPKSMIITENKVYISSITAQTLQRRFNEMTTRRK